MSKVWVVLAGYEDNYPAGVYTNEERAYEAAKILDGEGAEADLDYIPDHIPGEAPWRVVLNTCTNDIRLVSRSDVFPTEDELQPWRFDNIVICYVWSPAHGENAREEAISRARAKIDKFLAGEQAARLVNHGLTGRTNAGQALQPPLPKPQSNE